MKTVFDFPFKGQEQVFVSPKEREALRHRLLCYKLEVWEAKGGGSTDISLIRSNITIDSSLRTLRDKQSYYSRIIVAGTGGGCNQGGDEREGGNRGGFIGNQGKEGYRINGLANGGTQTFIWN